MGQRVLEFSRQYPDPSPGFVAAAARLQDRLTRAELLARQQVDGRAEMRVSTERKRELRRLITQAHLDHLANVAELASVEEPELFRKFLLPPDATTYLSFHAAASGIAAEAESRKELLLKHGLSEEVLNDLKVSLDLFETALEQGFAGRISRAGATAELVAVAEEVVQIVKVMNGMIRIRFANQPELLGAWEIATNVVATPRTLTRPNSDGTPPPGQPPVSGPPASGQPPVSGGEVRPAA
ncbi:MAG TPA: hypothetical protein VFH26_08475 [Gemmatimonadales bacterium]|nr:hypothetical protein [Gemmatimonadales bacterium]